MRAGEHNTLVELENLRYRYRRTGGWAIDGLGFRVERGVLLGLAGPNGSGKTTLYRMILGLMRPVSGRLQVGGRAAGVYRRERGIGYLPEQVRLPGNVRVRDFAALMARLAGARGAAVEGSTTRLMGALALQDQAGTAIGNLSHGFRQRVGLLAALLGDPELLLLDEPANGLDPLSVAVLRSVLRGLRRRGRTVIVSSHNLLELERICDRVVLLDQGRQLGEFRPSELATRGDLWVVQWSAEAEGLNPELAAVAGRSGGVPLATDEWAFRDREACRRFAAAMHIAGKQVAPVQRRSCDLEYLFHALVRNREGKGCQTSYVEPGV